MKKKTIWSLVLALALVVSAIGTATSAFAATSAPMEPVTKIATENEDAIWEQISSSFSHSAAFLWKMASLFSSTASICSQMASSFSVAEKETLMADIKELNGLDAEMEALYEKLPDCDNMPLYEKALEKADPKVLDEIDTLEQEYDRVCEKHTVSPSVPGIIISSITSSAGS